MGAVVRRHARSWFLNSGRAIAFTLGCVFAASLIGGVLRLPGATIAAGAATAMTLVLLLGASGTIVPIVLAAGGLMLAAASLLGAWLGWEIRWRSKPREPADGLAQRVSVVAARDTSEDAWVVPAGW